MATLALCNSSRVALVSDSDLSHVKSAGNWFLRHVANGGHEYVRGFIGGKHVYLHRFILNAPRGSLVDHINGDTLDNRRENIRLCTPAGNSRNQRKTNKPKLSRYKGVSRARKMWRAYIEKEEELIRLGNYRTEQEAAIAYDRAAITLFGEFACLNFPNGDTTAIQLTPLSQKKKIIQMDLSGRTLRKHDSLNGASRAAGITASNICMACQGERQSAGGYRWKYSEECT